MKKKELLREVRTIQRRIKDSKIVELCEEAVVAHGEMTRIHERDASSHVTWSYKTHEQENVGLRIRTEWGQYVMGDGNDLEVSYHGVPVLVARDKLDEGSDESLYPRAPCSGPEDYFVVEYHPGAWEKEVKKLVKTPRKEEKRKKPEVPDIPTREVERVRANYSKY